MALCCLLAGCQATPGQSNANPTARDAAADGTVLAGIDVFLAGDLTAYRGKRLGLITNHTGVTRDGTSTIDALFRHPGLELTTLFSPEHGIRGTADPGAAIERGRDSTTALPILSLYGTTRQPSAEMLRDVDVLLFDIQDIGARYYTYVWTMALALRAAAENHKPFVVLDRPDPIGGRLVQGNVLDTAFASFVGLYPVPMRHGMTAGELASWLNGQFGIGADLTVVKMQGWRRDRWFDASGLAWIPPSPNMPSMESAAHYPGTCLFEGTNLSVGRGTPIAFQQVGAPWLNAAEIARRLNARGLPGVAFHAVSFTPHAPGDGKYDGTPLAGIRFEMTDRARYDPTVAAVAALLEIRSLQGDSLTFRADHFDHLAGTDRLRLAILGGTDLETITAGWEARRAAFLQTRERYLLYP